KVGDRLEFFGDPVQAGEADPAERVGVRAFTLSVPLVPGCLERSYCGICASGHDPRLPTCFVERTQHHSEPTVRPAVDSEYAHGEWGRPRTETAPGYDAVGQVSRRRYRRTGASLHARAARDSDLPCRSPAQGCLSAPNFARRNLRSTRIPPEARRGGRMPSAPRT